MKKTTALATVNTNTAVATTKTTTAVANANKKNKLLGTEELTALMIENKLVPRFICGGFYVGLGIGRTNCFSINTRSKWTEYRIYCNDDTYKAVMKAKLAGVKCLLLDNKTDKVRPNTIEVANTEALKEVLKVIATNFKSFGIA